MKQLNEFLNYAIISTSIDNELLEKVSEYPFFNDDLTFKELEEKIEKDPNKRIVFNDCLRRYTKIEKEKILQILRERNMHFINITSFIEEILYADYLYVYDGSNLVIEGKTMEVLKEEKILKRLGFSLPFVVDLSTQLKYYGITNEIYDDIEKLVIDLWS